MGKAWARQQERRKVIYLGRLLTPRSLGLFGFGLWVLGFWVVFWLVGWLVGPLGFRVEV